MALGRCLTCVKYTLFVFSFVFWLVGCLLLAVGIWVLVDPGQVKGYATDHEWEASIVIYSMITVGSIMTIIGFLGCCGAIRESRCTLISFFIMLFVIHAIFISIGLYIMIRRENTSEWIPSPKSEEIAKRLNDNLARLQHDPSEFEYLTKLQTTYKCCVAEKSPLDHENPPHLAELYKQNPCKRKQPRFKACTDVLFQAETDRHGQLVKAFSKYVIIISAVILAVSFLMIVGMILSVIMCCALRNELNDTY